MKKLMIAAAIVCAAVAANASTFNWKNSGGASSYKVYDKSGTTLANGTAAYLLCTSDISQSDFLTGIRGAESASTYITDNAISGANNTVAAAKIPSSSNFNYGEDGGKYTFYYVILKGDDVLISDVANATGTKGTTSSIAFTKSATWSQVDKGTAAYSTAGWYAVPEPTSGLLLLLGMAGLALKRKRA